MTQDLVNVKDCGALGDGVSDDTQAFKVAIAAGFKIYLPPGVYLTDFGNATSDPDTITHIPSGRHFLGAGPSSVWRPFTRTAIACIGTESGDKEIWTEDLHFSDIKFYGWVEEDGHRETSGLIALSSVRRVLIQRCQFWGPRGDGLSINSGYGGGPNNERHNFDVTVRDCLFDGINNQNRNGISVIDVDGMAVENCRFSNLSRDDMPGSIDFEPNESYSYIRNARISGNTFSNCDGNRGHVALVPDNVADDHFQNVDVNHNTFYGNKALSIWTTEDIPESFPTQPQNIAFSDNTAVDCAYLVEKVVGPIWGLTIDSNRSWAVTPNHGRVAIGDGSTNWTVKELSITGNQITAPTSVPVSVTDNLETFKFSDNRIEGATQACLRIGRNGPNTENRRIVITDNMFLGTPSNGAVQHDGTATGITENIFRNNYKPVGVAHGFLAYQTDDTGIRENVYTADTPPSAFPYGESLATNKENSIDGSTNGTLKTYRLTSSNNNLNTYQVYMPSMTGQFKDEIYFRKAIDASTWDTWKRLTGAEA